MEDKDKCHTCIPARDTVCAGLVNLTELPEGGRGIVDRVSEAGHDIDHLVNTGHNPAFIRELEK